MNRKQCKLYIEKYWYINNYHALGSDWLIDVIYKLKPKKAFRLANLSANAAYYERDLYNSLREEYDPQFYVSDYLADELKDKKVETYGKFVYISGQHDACDIGIDLLDDRRIDILMDVKGALWYAANMTEGNSREKIIKLLTKYKSLLSEGGMLLIDYYDYHFFRTIKNWIYGGNRRCMDIAYLGEKSTKSRLQKIFGRKFLNENIRIIKPKYDQNHPLANHMRVGVITSETLEKMMEKLRRAKIIRVKYMLAKRWKLWGIVVIIMYAFLLIIMCGHM